MGALWTIWVWTYGWHRIVDSIPYDPPMPTPLEPFHDSLSE